MLSRNIWKFPVLFLLFLFIKIEIKAQKWLPDSMMARKGYSIFPLPVFYYAPETGFAFGAGATLTFHFKDDTVRARPSQIAASIVFTTKKQILTYIPFNIFIKNGKYLINGEFTYNKFNYNFYSYKEIPPIKEKFEYQSPKFIIKAFSSIPKKHIYYGWRFHYENFVIGKKEGMRLNAGDIPGSNGSLSIGTGPIILLDKRNQIFYPTKGYYSEIGATFFQHSLGSTFQFTRYNIDVVKYLSLNKDLVSASNVYFNYIQGTVPFNMASILGGNRRMRGYYDGYFRDNNTFLIQEELRLQILDGFLGGVVFGSTGWLGDEKETIRFNYPKFSAGMGLRIQFSEKDKLNLRLDYGIGKNSQAFYFTIGEAF